jgi:hypothetical protein
MPSDAPDIRESHMKRCCWLVCVLLLSGCGSGTYPVHGKLVWKDGAPATELAGSNVTFESTDQKTSAVGSIQPDGSFQLTTTKTNDGAPAGDYKVLIMLVGRPLVPGDDTRMAPGPIDSRYSEISTTNLTAKVTPGTNQITLTLERNQAQ